MGRHELPEGLEKGSTVAGKYRVDRVVGVGGMAVVVAATHVELDERVALKIMLPVLAEDPALVARFRREAKASSSLRSEHVVRVRDVDVLPTGEPFIVMELLEGRDLDQLSRRGHIPDADVVAYAIQACVGLADAHARGIIHRDVKPANLLLTRNEAGEPVVKVLDFGISRVRDEVALTSVGHVVGSLGYMPPEQLGAVADLDERADVYAMAITIYELLSRTRAYGGVSVIEVSQRIIDGAAPDLATLRPDLPPDLAALVMAAMHRHRDRRPRTIAELALALAPFASPHADAAVAQLRRRAERGSAPSQDEIAPPVEPAPPPVELAPPPVEPASHRVDRGPARGRQLAIQLAGLLTGVALALVIALVARLILGGGRG